MTIGADNSDLFYYHLMYHPAGLNVTPGAFGERNQSQGSFVLS